MKLAHSRLGRRGKTHRLLGPGDHWEDNIQASGDNDLDPNPPRTGATPSSRPPSPSAPGRLWAGPEYRPAPPPATRVTWPARGSRDPSLAPPSWSSGWGGEKRGKRGKRAGREVGEDEGEGTAGLLAGQRRLAEAAAAARPQVPRPGAAPPPAGSAAAGHVRPTLRPLPAPASSSAGRHRPVLATCPKFRVLFQCSAPPTARPAETPGLPCRGGVGGNLPLSAYCHQPGLQTGLLGVGCFLPLCRCETA